MSSTISGYACKGKGEPLARWSYESAALDADEIKIGICGSDIHTLDSGWGPTTYPVIVGHEIVGTVTSIGANVTRVKVGDRVGVGAQCNSCHDCDNCGANHENNCSKGTFTYNATHPSGRIAYGGYADAIVVPAAFAFKVPDEISSPEAAPLFCAGVTVFAPLKRHMTPGCRVGVVGIGGLGHLALQFAKALGANEVFAISHSMRKEADARALGATTVLDSTDSAMMAKHARSLDVIICTATAHDIKWEEYLGLLNVGGKLVICGLPESPISLNLGALIFTQVSIVGSLIGSPADIEAMLDCCKKFNVRPLVQKTPMKEVNEAITQVRKNNVRFRYVLEN